MNLINTNFGDFVNEARSINKIQNEWSKVTAEMADLAKVYVASEGDEKAKVLDQLKSLTAKKKSLEKELNDAVAGKDKDVQLVVTESTNKPAGLSKDETKKVAETLAKAIEKLDGKKCSVNMKTLEEDSFDLDYDGEAFAGGSYNIFADGTIKNMAIRNSPIYGKVGYSEAEFTKQLKKVTASHEAVELSEGAVKQFDADYNQMVKDIKSGYGWIDPEYVADTWENSSDSIDFELVKVELYKRLIKAGLLWTTEDGEEKDKQIKSLKELGIKESLVNESKIILKRKYTENHPAQTASVHAKIRNKVLEAIKDGKLTTEEFENLLKDFSSDSKRWLRRNSKYFAVSEDGISLSKYGMRVFNSISVNEATTKNPGIWVPGGFDKEISKLPNSKITREIVLKAAKKWDVDDADAIAYVEFGWDLDLNENNKNTNMQLFTSFTDFVNENFNNEEFVVEAFKSSQLSAIMSLKGSPYDKKSMQTIMAALYKATKVKLDEVTDDMLQTLTPAEAYKSKAPGFYFYISDNEKPNPYHDTNKGYLRNVPGNRLLAVANGNNEIYNLDYAPRWSEDKGGRVLKNAGKYGGDDTLGIEKKHSGYGASGLSNVKRLAEVSDRVLYFNPAVMPSSAEEKKARTEAKAGATALMDPKKIKQENISRYKEIIAQKLLSKADSLDKEVETTMNAVNVFITNGFTSKQMNQYGELSLGTDPKGRHIGIQDATNYLRNLLDHYSRYINATNSVQQSQDEWDKKYAEKQVKEYTLSTREYLKKWDEKHPNIVW